jgi:hypothetical protein
VGGGRWRIGNEGWAVYCPLCKNNDHFLIF